MKDKAVLNQEDRRACRRAGGSKSCWEGAQVRLGTLDGFNFTLDDLLCSRKMFSREADTFTLGAFECGSFDGSTSGDWNDTRVSFPFRGTSRCLRPQPRWSAMLRRSLSPWDTIFDGMVLTLCAL